MAPLLDQGASGWRKSTASGSQNECVEVGELPAGDIAVRDTKADGSGPVLGFTADAWSAFITDVKGGRFAV
jgi:hypothetical protein